jgi:hypothetical protein
MTIPDGIIASAAPIAVAFFVYVYRQSLKAESKFKADEIGLGEFRNLQKALVELLDQRYIQKEEVEEIVREEVSRILRKHNNRAG